MSGISAHKTEDSRIKLANSDVVIGKGVIKAVENDRELGYIWAIPGGFKTCSKERATKCATIINELIVKSELGN